MNKESFKVKYDKLLEYKKNFREYANKIDDLNSLKVDSSSENNSQYEELEKQADQLILDFLEYFEKCDKDFKNKFFNITFLDFINDSFESSKESEYKVFYKHNSEYPVIKLNEYINQQIKYNDNIEKSRLSVKKCFQDKFNFSDEDVKVIENNAEDFYFFNYILLIKKIVKKYNKKYDFLECEKNLYFPSNKELLEKGLLNQDILYSQRKITKALENFGEEDYKKYFKISLKEKYLSAFDTVVKECESHNKYFPIYMYTKFDDDDNSFDLSDILNISQANKYFEKFFKMNLNLDEKVVFYEDILKIVLSLNKENKQNILKQFEDNSLLKSNLLENENSHFLKLENLWFKFLIKKWNVEEEENGFSQILRNDKYISFVVFKASVNLLCEYLKKDFNLDLKLEENILKIPKSKYNYQSSNEMVESFIDILVSLDKKLIDKMILKKEKSILMDISWEDIEPKASSILKKIEMSAEVVSRERKLKIRKF